LTGKDLGLIGLGVMGQNLALNFQNHGYSIAVYNRTGQKTKDFVAKHSEISAVYTLREFVDALSRPRRVFMMVTAGPAVDAAIDNLSGLLSRGDVLMDGGNSHFKDTERRGSELEKLGISYLGVGVSGGEEGALRGPCLMVGGARQGYDHVSEMLRAIAAQVDGPCCEYLGPRGAGHYVKMVHNGIEYAIIQTIAEAYDLLTRGNKSNISQVRKIFKKWNDGELNSFLMEIATQVLKKSDPATGKPLVSVILDRAKQKGTGKWTSQNALDLGTPTPTIDAAVTARNLSALKNERVKAAETSKRRRTSGSFPDNFTDRLEGAVRASMIMSYAQGFHLMCAASAEYGYEIPFGEVARIWKGGCIIRARMLDSIYRAFKANANLVNLMVDPEFAGILTKLDRRWRDTVRAAKASAIPIPAISASLDYYDGYTSERLPANLIQALRDLFGAHGYERNDKSGEFHTDWAF
jgi:6-phosphogluconate dehydrogenase